MAKCDCLNGFCLNHPFNWMNCDLRIKLGCEVCGLVSTLNER